MNIVLSRVYDLFRVWKKNLKCLRGVVRMVEWFFVSDSFPFINDFDCYKKENTWLSVLWKKYIMHDHRHVYIYKSIYVSPKSQLTQGNIPLLCQTKYWTVVAESDLNWQDIDGHIWDTNRMSVGKCMQTMCNIAIQWNVWGI